MSQFYRFFSIYSCNFIILFALSVVFAACKTVEQPVEESTEDTDDKEVTEVDVSYGYDMMISYFTSEVDQIQGKWLDEFQGREDFEKKLPVKRQQYADMIGLWPIPERTDLNPVVTGTIVRDGIEVRKLHFQSLPGLYVTANLYLPEDRNEKLPGVLYLPGHTTIVEDGISYGPKAADHYQTHPIWYAKNGIVSLIIDTLHGSEIQGIHRGTHSHERWWWFNRGYTPAGVQAWNAIRALDYLETLDEVDRERLAVTGLSGGGADSWSLNALDDRPVTVLAAAGITDLQNYIIDQRISNHCDCMFKVNRYRWDIPKIASLGIPRPVLLSNNTEDHHFPLDGVYRTDEQLSRLYHLAGKPENWDILIRKGGHGDRPQRPDMYRFIHEKLTGEILDEEAYEAASPLFSREELLVFNGQLPVDERNTRIDEEFIRPAEIPSPADSRKTWIPMAERWKEQLSEYVFPGWPKEKDALNLIMENEKSLDDLRLRTWDYTSQGPVRLRLWQLDNGTDSQPERIHVRVLNSDDWTEWLQVLQSLKTREDVAEIIGPGARSTVWPDGDENSLEELGRTLSHDNKTLILVAPRGIGPTNWLSPDDERDPVRRSFMNIGQTRDGMQIWDVRRAVEAARKITGPGNIPVALEANNTMAGIALYTSLYEDIEQLNLARLPGSHKEWPILLNIDKVFDLPQALALAAVQSQVRLSETSQDSFEWTMHTLNSLGMTGQIAFTDSPEISAGSSGPEKVSRSGSPELVRLHLSADRILMKPGERQMIEFSAEMSDGSQLSLSDLSREEVRVLSLNPDVATAGSYGQVYARNTGAATIQVEVTLGDEERTAHLRIGVPERTLSEEDFVVDGPYGSHGAEIEKLGENHFLFRRGQHPEDKDRSNLPQFIIPENFRGNNLTLDITPLSYPAETHNYHMAYSFDGEHWTPILQELVGENVSRLRIPPSNSDSFYLGFQIPLSHETAQKLKKQWASDPKTAPYVTLHRLGHSLQGRPLYRMEITDPDSPHERNDRWKHYIAQAHPHEGKSRWRVRGMIDWLLSDAPEAADARKRHIWHFVLTMNPDGLNNGFTRVNAEGMDMNRTFLVDGADRSEQAHEGYVYQRDIETFMESDHPLTTFWDMHVWGREVEPMVHLGPEFGEEAGQLGSWEKLRDLIESHDEYDLIIPLAIRRFEGQTTLWDRGVHHRYGITSAIVEGSGYLDTQEENMKAGEALIKSINEFYRGTRLE